MNRPQKQLSLFLGFSLFLLSFNSGCSSFSFKKNADYQALEDRVGQLEKFSQEQQARVASPPAPKPEPKAEPAKAQPTPALVSSPAPEEKKAEIQGSMEELYPQARAG